MTYSANTDDLARQAAGFVDRILRGTNPGDLPIARPSKFDFVINLKTAKRGDENTANEHSETRRERRNPVRVSGRQVSNERE